MTVSCIRIAHLEDKHFLAGVLCESVRKHAAGRATSDNDVVILFGRRVDCSPNMQCACSSVVACSQVTHVKRAACRASRACSLTIADLTQEFRDTERSVVTSHLFSCHLLSRQAGHPRSYYWPFQLCSIALERWAALEMPRSDLYWSAVSTTRLGIRSAPPTARSS